MRPVSPRWSGGQPRERREWTLSSSDPHGKPLLVLIPEKSFVKERLHDVSPGEKTGDASGGGHVDGVAVDTVLSCTGTGVGNTLMTVQFWWNSAEGSLTS